MPADFNSPLGFWVKAYEQGTACTVHQMLNLPHRSRAELQAAVHNTCTGPHRAELYVVTAAEQVVMGCILGVRQNLQLAETQAYYGTHRGNPKQELGRALDFVETAEKLVGILDNWRMPLNSLDGAFARCATEMARTIREDIETKIARLAIRSGRSVRDIQVHDPDSNEPQ